MRRFTVAALPLVLLLAAAACACDVLSDSAVVKSPTLGFLKQPWGSWV